MEPENTNFESDYSYKFTKYFFKHYLAFHSPFHGPIHEQREQVQNSNFQFRQ